MARWEEWDEREKQKSRPFIIPNKFLIGYVLGGFTAIGGMFLIGFLGSLLH